MKLKAFLYVFLFTIILSSFSLNAQNYIDNWPNWRGPNFDGVSLNGTPPIEWSETKNIKWKTQIPGKGLGTPVVLGNQIFITTTIVLDEQETEEAINRLKKTTTDKERLKGLYENSDFLQFVVYSINRKTGEINWKKIVREQYPDEEILEVSSFASASCVTDGEHIVASFGSYGVYCFDMSGNMIWEKDLGNMEDPLSLGEGTSPVIYKDNLVIVWDHPGKSYIYVFNKKTGKEIWQKNRSEITTWATPIVVEIDNGAQIIIPAKNRSRGYNLETGDVIWELSGLGSSVIPCPIFDGERVFLMTGFSKVHIIQAINLKTAKGNLDNSSNVTWTYNKSTPYVSSALLKDGKLYYLKGSRALLSCVDSKTGKIYYEALKLKGLLTAYASPVSANGNIYIMGRKGICSIIKEGTELEFIAQNKLDDSFDASPAIVGKELFLRGHKSLYCISE